MKIEMIEGWAVCLAKAWSVRLTALWGLLIAYFAQYPDQWEQVRQALPEAWRPLASVGLGFAIFASIGGSRVVAQKALAKQGADQQ